MGDALWDTEKTQRHGLRRWNVLIDEWESAKSEILLHPSARTLNRTMSRADAIAQFLHDIDEMTLSAIIGIDNRALFSGSGAAQLCADLAGYREDPEREHEITYDCAIGDRASRRFADTLSAAITRIGCVPDTHAHASDLEHIAFEREGERVTLLRDTRGGKLVLKRKSYPLKSADGGPVAQEETLRDVTITEAFDLLGREMAAGLAYRCWWRERSTAQLFIDPKDLRVYETTFDTISPMGEAPAIHRMEIEYKHTLLPSSDRSYAPLDDRLSALGDSFKRELANDGYVCGRATRTKTALITRTNEERLR